MINAGEICVLLRYYAALSGSSVPTFRDNLSAPSSLPLKLGPMGCPETSVRNYHSVLRNTPEERRSHVLRVGSLKSRSRQQFPLKRRNVPSTKLYGAISQDTVLKYVGTHVSECTASRPRTRFSLY
jgi:hypothetical protein